MITKMKIEQKSPLLNILVIGANGGIGRQTIFVALNAGYHVTALLRNPANLTLTHENLQIVKGDILQPETFEKHLANQDAIISAIGEKNREPTTLYSDGNRNLLHAMRKKGIKRAFFISASAIEISPVQPFIIRLVTRFVVQKLFGNGYADQRIMEKLVKESDINYTIMRPPRLTDTPATGKYRFAINGFLKNCLKISRADVAHFMINNIGNEATYRSTIEIAY
jgi:putative NADH-flavin reductase